MERFRAVLLTPWPELQGANTNSPPPFRQVATLTLWEQFQLRASQGAPEQELAVRAGINLSPLNAIIPFVGVEGGAYAYGLERELPTVSPRALNEANDDSLGRVTQESEVLKIYGKDVKTDRAAIDMYGMRAHRQQLDMNIKALRVRVERDFIKGNKSENGGRNASGLESLITPGSSQYISNHATAGPLSASKLDELIDAVDVPPGEKRLVVGKAMGRILGAAVRTPAFAGNVDFRLNELGRQATFYNDVEIIRTDVDETNTPIQGFNEPNSTTSIYCVALGEGLVTGIQGFVDVPNGGRQEGLSVYDIGEMHQTPHMLTRIAWYINFVMENKRAAARLDKITNATPVA
jgi:hypothetical protein